MKIVTSVFFLALLCNTPSALAHDDHVHIDETSALTVGKETAAELSQKDAGLGFGKLPASWAKVPAKNIRLHKKGTAYFIVALTNDMEKKTLYVLISEEGEAFDANFTGEFKGLK